MAGKASVPCSARYPATQLLQGTHSYISTDLYKLFEVSTYNNKRSFITFLDKGSRFLEVRLSENKKEVLLEHVYIVNICRMHINSTFEKYGSRIVGAGITPPTTVDIFVSNTS